MDPPAGATRVQSAPPAGIRRRLAGLCGAGALAAGGWFAGGCFSGGWFAGGSWLLAGGLGPGVGWPPGAVLLAQAAEPAALPLRAGLPILAADAQLQRQGWLAAPAQTPAPFERELAGNTLASLDGCAGTGLGLCRYAYRRGPQRLVLITVPSAQAPGGAGDGQLLRWWLEPAAAP